MKHRKNQLKRNLLSLLALSSLWAFGLVGVSIHGAQAMTRSLPVEVAVPATSVVFSGRAAPAALVTVKKSAGVIGTTTADSGGLFSLELSATSGLHTYSISYEDTNGRVSAVVERTVSVQPQQSNIFTFFLSPTLQLPLGSVLSLGSLLPLEGTTIPNSAVELLVNNGAKRYETQSGPDGEYRFLFSTNELGVGNFVFQTRTQVGAERSEISRVSNLAVRSLPQTPPPDIRVRPQQLPPPVVLLPLSGTEITGDRVLLQGDSLPFAQIVVYVNGVEYGATAADQAGRWEYLFVAQKTPVQLSFTACLEEVCSVLSDTLNLSFVFEIQPCELQFQLQSYRFWQYYDGVPQVLAAATELSPDAKITVAWGDGRISTYTAEEAVLGIETNYAEPGEYAGTVTYETADCAVERYFSVYEVQGEDRSNWWAAMTLALLFLSLFLLNHKNKNPKLGKGTR